MILTGKAKEDFKKWLNKEMYYLGRHNFEDRDNNIEDLSDNFKNTLIIEWFDSIKYNEIWNLWDFSFKKIFYSNNNLSILQIQEKAIEKANEIYNETTRK